MPNDQAQHEPRLTGWGRDESNQLLHFEVTGFGERVCVVHTKDGWKAGTWRAMEEIAARQADAQASPPASEGASLMPPDSWQPILAALRQAIPDFRQRDPLVVAFWKDLEDAQAARLAEVEAELAAVRQAAHMPDDYEHGLPSWINQRLYAAWIGATFSPEVMEQIKSGALRFEDSPDAKRAQALEAELAKVREQMAFAEKHGWNRLLADYIDQFMRDAIVAIAGAVCTPENGYVEDGGLQLLLADIKRLRKQHDWHKNRNGVVAQQFEQRDLKIHKLESELTALRSSLLEKAAEWRGLADWPPEKIGPAGPRQMLRRLARELETLAKEGK